jgi:hypothetical protein
MACRGRTRGHDYENSSGFWLSTPGENRTLSPAENRTLGTGGDEPQVVYFSFDLGVLFRGDEAEAESPELSERHSSV